jgi:hypothetical protein
MLSREQFGPARNNQTLSTTSREAVGVAIPGALPAPIDSWQLLLDRHRIRHTAQLWPCLETNTSTSYTSFIGLWALASRVYGFPSSGLWHGL